MKQKPTVAVSGFCSLTVVALMAFAAQGAEIYWSEGGWQDAGKIYRGGLDGTAKELLVSSIDAISVLQLDAQAEQIYWAGDKIQRANFNGMGIEELIGTGINFSEGLALDLESGTMYWSDWNGTIKRAGVDGSSAETLYTGTHQLFGLALDTRETTRQLYWSSSDRDIHSAAVIAEGMEPAFTVVDGGVEPLGVVLDPVDNMLYWTDWMGQKVWRYYLDGQTPGSAEVVYSTSVGNPAGIFLDVTDRKLYWSEWNTDQIVRSDLDGSNIEVLFSTGPRPWGVSVIPEPCTVLLLSFGAILLRKRR